MRDQMLHHALAHLAEAIGILMGAGYSRESVLAQVGKLWDRGAAELQRRTN